VGRVLTLLPSASFETAEDSTLFGLTTPHLLQGEVAVTDVEQQKVTTILGSCVATLIWDHEARVGGLNHLLLPNHVGASAVVLSHEVNLMELLINGVLRAGGRKNCLQAKTFGGAQVVEGLGQTGIKNSEFVSAFLKDENIPCVAQSLGGLRARKLQVWPAIGRARLKFLEIASDTVSARAPRKTLNLIADELGRSGVELL